MNLERRELPIASWRRPPARIATRVRCAIAILILALAVAMAAIPAFAGRVGGAQAAGPDASGATAVLPVFIPAQTLKIRFFRD